MNSYTVYVHISPSNKKYVGITGGNVDDRWRNGSGYFRNPYFTKAIKKYGWVNFKHQIVAEGLTKLEAEKLEKELINKYQSNKRGFGYNIKSGGDSNGKHSDESRLLMSTNRKGKGTNKRSESTRKRMSENHAGGNDPKKVLCVETGVVYKSINDASRAIRINKKVISCCCREIAHYKTGGGYHWRFV